MTTPHKSDSINISTETFAVVHEDLSPSALPIEGNDWGQYPTNNGPETRFLPDSVAENLGKPHSDVLYTASIKSVDPASFSRGDYPVSESQPPIGVANVQNVAHDLRAAGMINAARGVESLMVTEADGQVTRLPGIGGLLDMIDQHGGVISACKVNVVNDPGLLGADSSHIRQSSLQSEIFAIGSSAIPSSTTERAIGATGGAIRRLAAQVAFRRRINRPRA